MARFSIPSAAGEPYSSVLYPERSEVRKYAARLFLAGIFKESRDHSLRSGFQKAFARD
jgi:hypothetical protein